MPLAFPSLVLYSGSPRALRELSHKDASLVRVIIKGGSTAFLAGFEIQRSCY